MTDTATDKAVDGVTVLVACPADECSNDTETSVIGDGVVFDVECDVCGNQFLAHWGGH